MRLVGLMLASNNTENHRSYLDMVTACKETWIKDKHPNVDIVSTWGNKYESHLISHLKDCEYIVTQDNDMLIQTPESRGNLAIKSIKGMEYALEKYPDLDYVFRPNCGSYINTHLLHDFLLDKPRVNYYAGIPVQSGRVDLRFASGACYLLSRDLVELIVEKQNRINLDGWRLMDDCSIGLFLKSEGIKFTETKTRWNY